MQGRKTTAGKLLIATVTTMLLLGAFGTRAYAFTNGQSASLVIGQKDFTSSHTATSRSGLNVPAGKSFDSSGNLWVTDVENKRILEFTASPVPEFPTASLAIIALVSLAVVTVATRKFSVGRTISP